MPIYVYRCETCGITCEEIQKVGAEAPEAPSDLSQCPRAREVAEGGLSAPCELKRELTTAGHRFKADLSNDGVGGYERQGDVMIRQVPGKNSDRYGTDRSGRG